VVCGVWCVVCGVLGVVGVVGVCVECRKGEGLACISAVKTPFQPTLHRYNHNRNQPQINHTHPPTHEPTCAQVNVLDKTKMDWQDYKAADTAVEEELEAHKRSGAQYLDRQEFLKRTELREYELERDKRLASDMRTRGRL